MLCSWQQAAATLEVGEIFKEDYDKWRYRYPEFDKAPNYVKVPPRGISEMSAENLHEVQND